MNYFDVGTLPYGTWKIFWQSTGIIIIFYTPSKYIIFNDNMWFLRFQKYENALVKVVQLPHELIMHSVENFIKVEPYKL